jgi:hypothetical protein
MRTDDVGYLFAYDRWATEWLLLLTQADHSPGDLDMWDRADELGRRGSTGTGG